MALIPIPVLLKLNVSRSKKLGLIGIFLLGLFTTICSIQRYLQIDRIQFGDGNSTMLVLWGVIEFNVGVSLCLPLFSFGFVVFSFFFLFLCQSFASFWVPFAFLFAQHNVHALRIEAMFSFCPILYITRAGEFPTFLLICKCIWKAGRTLDKKTPSERKKKKKTDGKNNLVEEFILTCAMTCLV